MPTTRKKPVKSSAAKAPRKAASAGPKAVAAKAPAGGKSTSSTKAKVSAKSPAPVVPKAPAKPPAKSPPKPASKSAAAPGGTVQAPKAADAGRFSKMAGGSSAKSTVAPASSAAQVSSSGRFSVHPSVRMMVDWVAELKPKTGRSLDEWVDLVKTQCPGGLSARVEFLKARHGMGTNSAWWIAERAEGRGAEDLDPNLYLEAAERYVEEQLAGRKAALKPVFERLLAVCLSLGDGVRACPCKTIVPIYRNHVVAQLKVAANGRVDLGLALGEVKATGRLIDTGGLAKKDRITHRIEIARVEDIDAQVEGWLKQAFARDA
ncbi:MAG: DUF5655 domain-containing protein [Phycisphaerales bacterium]